MRHRKNNFSKICNKKINDKKINDKKINDKKINDKKINDKKINDKKINDNEINNIKICDVFFVVKFIFNDCIMFVEILNFRKSIFCVHFSIVCKIFVKRHFYRVMFCNIDIENNL